MFINDTITSDIYLTLCCNFPEGIWHSNKFSLASTRVPDLKPAMPLCFLHGSFQGESPVKLSNQYPALIEEGLSRPPISRAWNFELIFCGGSWRTGCLKKLHTIPELKTAIQSDSEAISSEILT
jgi:hypothetical protein